MTAPLMSRTFHIDTRNGVTDAVLTIFPPSDEGGGEFRCRYELVAPIARASSAIAGVDELQSLMLALRMSIVELNLLAKRIGGTVREHEVSDLRLP